MVSSSSPRMEWMPLRWIWSAAPLSPLQRTATRKKLHVQRGQDLDRGSNMLAVLPAAGAIQADVSRRQVVAYTMTNVDNQYRPDDNDDRPWQANQHHGQAASSTMISRRSRSPSSPTHPPSTGAVYRPVTGLKSPPRLKSPSGPVTR